MSDRRERGPRPVGASLPRLLSRLGGQTSPATLEAVFTRWEEVVGSELGGHVRPLRIDGRTLIVAADHPTWATRARMDSGRVLAAVNALAGDALDRVEVVVERG